MEVRGANIFFMKKKTISVNELLGMKCGEDSI